jgi:hydroxypyruvate isomerase
MNQENSRRDMIKKVASAALATTALSSLSNRLAAHDLATTGEGLKGKINHSVCAWCYNMPLEELCIASKKIGITSIDLVAPQDFGILKKYDLHCAMVASNGEFGITNGFNNPANHDKLVDYFKQYIDETAKAGFTNLICFSGNRNGLDDEQGIKNCTEGLQKIISYAEKKKVTLVMELLNSRVDHHDYQCDHTAWGVELCKSVGSENFKLLYDIYHMQIMDGDIIHHIRDFNQYFAHYHTGGVPGRHEINDSQELNYPAIMKAIVETGFKGYVAQEFVPSPKDSKGQLASLEQAVGICDIA